MSKSSAGFVASRQTSRTDCQGDQEHDEEALDPRIQIELEKLNSSTDVINKLEIDLEEARATFRMLLSDSGQQLSRLSRQLGTCVDRARPYYEARMRSRHALIEAQRAAARFEKASSQHEAAKEMVLLAEEGYIERGMPFDQAWQEMLNHSTTRVNESEVERNLSAEEHRAKSHAYQLAEARVQDLQRNLKRNINKSRPYFELKARFNQTLDDQKRQVQLIEETIVMTKQGYSDSLKELEKISEEIHERRKRRKELGVREAGVGAESPPPSPKHEIAISAKKLEDEKNLKEGIDRSHSTKPNQGDLKEGGSSKMTTTLESTFEAKAKSSGDKTSCQVSKDQSFFIDPLNVRVQPLGASSSASTPAASSGSGVISGSPASALPPTSTTSSTAVAAQPPPLPPRKFIPSIKTLPQERSTLSSSSTITTTAAATTTPSSSTVAATASSSSTTASSSSTSRSSSLKSPSYEKLTDSPFKTPIIEETRCDADQSTCDAFLSDDEGSSANVTPSKKNHQAFEFITPNRLQLPSIRRVVGDEDDMSDTDSLASMEMLDDDQIEQLMKEMSLESNASLT